MRDVTLTEQGVCRYQTSPPARNSRSVLSFWSLLFQPNLVGISDVVPIVKAKTLFSSLGKLAERDMFCQCCFFILFLVVDFYSPRISESTTPIISKLSGLIDVGNSSISCYFTLRSLNGHCHGNQLRHTFIRHAGIWKRNYCNIAIQISQY